MQSAGYYNQKFDLLSLNVIRSTTKLCKIRLQFIEKDSEKEELSIP